MNTKINQPKDDFSYIDFGDKRLSVRLQKTVENLTKNTGASILGSGKGRSEAKGFYRLLSNEKFDMSQLQGAVYGSTLSRLNGIVLLIQDTSDINLNGHKKTESPGYSSEHVKGIKLHSCIAMSPLGIPFGLASQSYETREVAKSAGKQSRPIEEKESYRRLETMREATEFAPEGVHYVTVCDREGDFYELYAEAIELETDFVIRVTHDRNCDENEKTASKIRRQGAVGTVTVNIPRDSRSGAKARTAEMEVAYIQRWKIERFHYVLKSGCNAEKIQQRTFERIKPVLLIYSVIALYVMAVTYMGREVHRIHSIGSQPSGGLTSVIRTRVMAIFGATVLSVTFAGLLTVTRQ